MNNVRNIILDKIGEIKNPILKQHLLNLENGYRKFSDYWMVKSSNNHLRMHVYYMNCIAPLIDLFCFDGDKDEKNLSRCQCYYFLLKVNDKGIKKIMKLPHKDNQDFVQAREYMIVSWQWFQSKFESDKYFEKFPDTLKLAEKIYGSKIDQMFTIKPPNTY